MNQQSSSKSSSAKEWFERGNKLKRNGNLTDALEAYRNSIKLNSNVASPWLGLAQVLQANSQFEDARQCLIQATIVEPNNLPACQQLAIAHKNLGYVEAAEKQFSEALKIDSNSAATYFGLAQLLEDIGQPEEAASAYRSAISLEPSKTDALACLLGLGRHTGITKEIAAAYRLIDTLNLRDKALIGYGLGKAHEQQENYDAAFKAFKIANDARREANGVFSHKNFDKRIQELIRLFSSEFFDARPRWGDNTERQVFIVGLPRSGTTLTEQILASHPQCFGAGELDVLTDLATGMPDRLGTDESSWPFCAPTLSRNQSKQLGQDYCAASSVRAPANAVRIIDKQPLNFWHLALVAIALPNAKIIHCTRDIRDCGLSIYTQNFNVQQNWSTNLNDIAHYWKGYRKLMNHWERVSGLSFLNVVYEDTVTDFEAQARRLLDFVDLPWDDRVLHFHTSERAIQTPSRWQVRQPLYQSSKERWRQYEEHLDSLIEAANNYQ